MDTIKLNGKKPKMIAHRGVSGLECENTAAAFLVAGAKSYFGIETDAHITSDGAFIICHDHNVQRVSGYDLTIEQTQFLRLRSLRLRNPRDGASRADLVMPTPDEYVEICKKYAKTAVLEIKSGFELSTLPLLIESVEGADYADNVIYISFFKDALINLRKLRPNAHAQFLTGPFDKDTLKFMNDYNLGLDIDYNSLSEDIVAACHADRKEVNCWTVDDVEAAKRLTDWGVDYITSNILE